MLQKKKAAKRPKPFDIAHEQYQRLRDQLDSTRDVQERNLIFRRLINLLGVMQFLNAQNGPSHAGRGLSAGTFHCTAPAAHQLSSERIGDRGYALC